MLSGDFERYLRKLNKNIRIYCLNDDKRPAGVFHVVNGEYTEICGIDKNYIPEHSIMAENGTHIKGGWRRVLKLLINKGLINRQQAEKLFRTNLQYKVPKASKRSVNLPVNLTSYR